MKTLVKRLLSGQVQVDVLREIRRGANTAARLILDIKLGRQDGGLD